MREKMKKENPKLVMSEFMKTVSMEWTRMSQEEKKRYDRLVHKDRQRFDTEFLEYKRNLSLGDTSVGLAYGGNYGQEEPEEFDQEDRDYKKSGDNGKEGVLSTKFFKHLHEDMESFSQLETYQYQTKPTKTKKIRSSGGAAQPLFEKLGEDDDSELSIEADWFFIVVHLNI